MPPFSGWLARVLAATPPPRGASARVSQARPLISVRLAVFGPGIPA